MINSVGYVDYYNATNNYQGVRTYTPDQEVMLKTKSINPFTDRVYVDPKTGELTTWKPGIYNPEQQKNNTKRAVTLLGLVGSLALAFVFRGKIKTAAKQIYHYAKPYASKILKGAKDFTKGAVSYVKPAAEKVVNFVQRGVSKVKPYISRAVNYVKDIFKK